MPVTNLLCIQQRMIVYGMTSYLIIGLIGNICNFIVFTHRSYRHRASSSYFLSISIIGIIYLMWAIPPIIYTVYYPDPQTQSIPYCRVKQYGSLCLGQCIRYLVVLACADRFFVTRDSVRFRSLHSIPVASSFIIIIIIVCFLMNIHVIIFTDLRNGTCGVVGLYRFIFSIYQLTMVGILPPLLMSIFSIFTLRKLGQRYGFQRRLKQKDRYLFRMVMAEVIANVCISIPFSINLVYSAVTFYDVNKSQRRLEIEAFVGFVTQFMVYFTGVVPFYLFIFTSKPFRRGFIHILAEFRGKHFVRENQIAPSNAQNNNPMYHTY